MADKQRQLDDQTWAEVREYLAKTLGAPVLKKRIRAIQVRSKYRWQPDMYIEVGGTYRNIEKDSPPDKIIAIYESSIFCLVSESRGCLTGIPYMFNKEDVQKVEEWDKN